jgi:hypothetical protein
MHPRRMIVTLVKVIVRCEDVWLGLLNPGTPVLAATSPLHPTLVPAYNQKPYIAPHECIRTMIQPLSQP